MWNGETADRAKAFKTHVESGSRVRSVPARAMSFEVEKAERIMLPTRKMSNAVETRLKTILSVE